MKYRNSIPTLYRNSIPMKYWNSIPILYRNSIPVKYWNSIPILKASFVEGASFGDNPVFCIQLIFNYFHQCLTVKHMEERNWFMRQK